MTNPAIVVITFNRPASLLRMLGSLTAAEYPEANVSLVISIDFEDSANHSETARLAETFDWPYGKKTVIQHAKNLGLRKHVIECGNLSSQLGDIIMLEDDIYVSPQFYRYAGAMLQRYGNDERVAGISLYKHLWNVNVSRPFTPADHGHDVFFMQFAQSWGQCWNSRMWLDFYTWYLVNGDYDFEKRPEVPGFVAAWSARSWLKYFIAFTIVKKKYFVYPYQSLSTNFSDVGSHVKAKNFISQVPLLLAERSYDNLPEVEHGVRYDAFFEREGMGQYLEIPDDEICIDLYGSKRDRAARRYWLTCAHAAYRVRTSYALALRPHEANVILNNPGNDIFLYDTSAKDEAVRKAEPGVIRDILYDIRDLSFKGTVKLLLHKIKSKLP